MYKTAATIYRDAGGPYDHHHHPPPRTPVPIILPLSPTLARSHPPSLPLPLSLPVSSSVCGILFFALNRLCSGHAVTHINRRLANNPPAITHPPTIRPSFPSPQSSLKLTPPKPDTIKV